ncbi:hypothetical protein [Ciceribacter azotifigens]|uniref:hypothetical protein n=1 Tax=Ciceribacter azotifigens TaxID=2069303 RepID=UPI003A84AA77
MAKPIILNREVRDGYAVKVDQHGVIWRSSNPSERPREDRQGFNLNLERIRSTERLILGRHEGPCYTRERAFAYATVAANALTMARVVRGWSINNQRALEWITKWCPCIIAEEAETLVSRIASRPRGMTARRAGSLLNVSSEEIERYGLRTLAPADKSAAQITRDKKARKNKMDRERIAAERRAKGVKPIEEVSAGSVAAFCRKHGIHRSSFRKAAERGAEALRAFLAKKGIDDLPANVEKWPDLSVGNRIPTEYNTATPLATFTERATLDEGNLHASILRFQGRLVPLLRATAIATDEINRKVTPVAIAARRLTSAGAR